MTQGFAGSSGNGLPDFQCGVFYTGRAKQRGTRGGDPSVWCGKVSIVGMSAIGDFPPLIADNDAGSGPADEGNRCPQRDSLFYLSPTSSLSPTEVVGVAVGAPRDPDLFHHRSSSVSSDRTTVSTADDNDDPRVVFVGGVPYSLSAATFSVALESKYGPVLSVRLVPHRKGKDGEHKGYGFVTFADESAAVVARDSRTMELSCGTNVQVGKAEKGIGKFSDDRSSTATVTSVDSMGSSAVSYSSWRHGGSSNRRRNSVGDALSGSENGVEQSMGHIQTRNRGGGTSASSRSSSSHRRGGRNTTHKPFHHKDLYQSAYWELRNRLEYEYAFETALRDFYREHGLDVPASGGVVNGAVGSDVSHRDWMNPAMNGVMGMAPGLVLPPMVPSMGTAFRGVAGTPIEKASTFGEREIFVGGLPLDTNDNDLVLFFSRWGHVEGARVMYYRSTGVSRRFGFVRFANVHVAMAVKALKKTDFPDGTEVVVGDIKLAKEMQEANEDTSSSPENCVNSSGISRTSSDVSESDLRNLGHALRAIAFWDPSGEKRSEKNGSGIDSNSSSSPSTSDSPPLSDTGTPGATSNASTVDTEEHGGSGSGNEMLSGPAETNAAAKRSTSPPTVLRRRYPLVDCK